MRKGFLGSVFVLLLGSGLTQAQWYPNGTGPMPSYGYQHQHPQYYNQPTGPTAGSAIRPVSFHHNDQRGIGVFQRFYNHMQEPPHPPNPIQTSVNGHLTAPQYQIVGEDAMVGAPNQPYLHDDISDYPETERPMRRTLWTPIRPVTNHLTSKHHTQLPAACPQGGCEDAACPTDECVDGACPQVCEADCVDDYTPYMPPQEICTYTPPGHHLYGSAEFVYWMLEGNSSPPLLSVGPLGAPGSQTLVGSLQDIDDGQRMGGRFTVGTYLDPSETTGLEGTFVFLGDSRKSLQLANLQAGAGVPFFNVATGAQDFFPIGAGGPQSTFALLTSTQFWTVDVNYRNELFRCDWYHFDAVAGARVIEFEESLAMATSSTGGGNTISTLDEIDTINMYYGGQLGFLMEFHKKCWFLNVWNKTMIGVNQQSVNLSGSNTTNGATVAGGIITSPGSIGSRTRARFSIVPEIGINAGFQVCDYVRVTGGYTAIYLSSVLRSGDQIVGSAGPSGNYAETDMWIHGWNTGLEFRY